MERKASAQWNGGLKDGKGAVSTASGALKCVPDSFAMRFGDTPGTNPEELVAAAHAGCFSMALSGELERAGYRPERIETKATLNFDNFFFQAEDGIRDHCVTGVQTCALPI